MTYYNIYTTFISFIIFSTFKVQEVNVNEACIR